MDQNPQTNISATPQAPPKPGGITSGPIFAPSTDVVISVANVVKDFGKIKALKGVTLNVHKGEIFGLLGQNGAGKTTLVKILLGLTAPTEGEVRLLGLPPGNTWIRQKVGYLPEDHRFPDYHTAASLLDFYGSLLEMPTALKRQRAAEALDVVGLSQRQNDKIRTYSKGMKQRVGIAQAIFHDPEVIFLDEPTDGVDPIGRREIRELLRTLKDKGTTVFINSHLLGEVELLCDRVVILQKGEIIRQGDIATLTQQKGFWVVGLAPGQAMPMEAAHGAGYRVAARGEYWDVELTPGQNIDGLIDLLRQKGLNLRHLVEKRVSLEDFFLATVDEQEPGVDKQRGKPRRRSL